MHWTVAAPFIHNLETDGEWLVPYVSGDRHQFSVVPRAKPLANWHNRSSSATEYQEWLVYLQQGKDAVRATGGGVVTVFPQLALAVGIQQRAARRRIPVVAWLFNVGTCPGGMRRWLAQASLQDVDRFIVHTRRECDIYSQWLGIPKERFEFFLIKSQKFLLPIKRILRSLLWRRSGLLIEIFQLYLPRSQS